MTRFGASMTLGALHATAAAIAASELLCALVGLRGVASIWPAGPAQSAGAGLEQSALLWMLSCVALFGGRWGGRVVVAVVATVFGFCALTLAREAGETTLDPFAALRGALPFDPAPGTPESTAGAAVLLALASVAIALRTRWVVASQLLGASCAALATTSLTAQLTGLRLEGDLAPWVRLPIGAALCLVALGGGLLAPEGVRTRRPRFGSAVLAGIAAASFTLLLWQALREREERQFAELARAGAERVEVEVRAGLARRGEGLATLAREWERRLVRFRAGLESDARLLLAQADGLVGLEWIESDGRVSWRYPAERALPPLAPARGDTSDPRAWLTGPFALDDGAPGIRVVAPLFREQETIGWLAATFEAEALFRSLLSEVDPAWSVVVYSGDTILFRNEPASSRLQLRFTIHRGIAVAGTLPLGIRVQPSDPMIARVASSLPEVLLGGGLILSGLLALAMGLRSLAAARAIALRREATRHERAAREVGRLNRELESRVAERTAELERSNRDLAGFASFLSHELRQPLGTQAVWAELLCQEHGRDLDEHGRRCAEELRANTKRMSELLDAQLSLASVRDVKIDVRDVDLSELVHEVLATQEPELHASGATVQVEALPAVRGDATLLGQLVRNLIENAIKYRVRDRALEIHVSGDASERGARLEVCDNGNGFPEAAAASIFEPSVRLSPESGPGQGLGLALCKRIAERHGGSITAAGNEGEGARFTLLLPIATVDRATVDRATVDRATVDRATAETATAATPGLRAHSAPDRGPASREARDCVPPRDAAAHQPSTSS